MLKTMNCGNCTNGTKVAQTNVTCTNLTNDSEDCIFSITLVLCGNQTESTSNFVLVKSTAPKGT